MKKLAIIAALLASFGAAHAEEEWIPLTKAARAETYYDVKRHSGEYIDKKRDQYRVIIRIREEDKGETSYNISVVQAQDCLAGYGRIRHFRLSGEPMDATDYVLTGTTVGDSLAKSFCAAALQAQERSL